MALVCRMFFIFYIVFFCFCTNAQSRSYAMRLCESTTAYECHKVKRGETWKRLFPDPIKRDIVMRINRVNTPLRTGTKIAIPKNLSTASLMEFAPFPTHIEPRDRKTIIVSLSQLAWGAYDENGTLVRWGPASGGKGYCADVRRRCTTKIGTFKIYDKRGRGCYSTKFPVGRGGAPMPYCMFFHGGFALHGSYEVPGYNASHGCVRLYTDDARWLNREFAPFGTSVIVKH